VRDKLKKYLMIIILIKYKYDNKYLPNININTFLIYSLYFLSYWTILKLIGRSIIIVSTKNKIKLNKNDWFKFSRSQTEIDD